MIERPPPPDRGSPLWKRWQEVDRLFEAALDMPGSHRAAFLRDQCAGDTELYDLLAELLEITATADTRVDGPSEAMLRAALGRSEADGTPGEPVGRPHVIGGTVKGDPAPEGRRSGEGDASSQSASSPG